MSSISIANMDKAKVFVALYKGAKVRNSFHHYATISYGVAVQVLERQMRFNVFEGKALYVDLSSNMLNVTLYDQYNGKNAAQSALQYLIRESQLPAVQKSTIRVPVRPPVPAVSKPVQRAALNGLQSGSLKPIQKMSPKPAAKLVSMRKPVVRPIAKNPIKKETPPDPVIDDYQVVNPERINQLEAIIKFEQDKLTRQQRKIDIFERFAGLARDLDRLEFEEQAANLKNPMIEYSVKEYDIEVLPAPTYPAIAETAFNPTETITVPVVVSENVEESDSDSVLEINVSYAQKMSDVSHPQEMVKKNSIDKSKEEIDDLFKALNMVQHKKIEEVAIHLLEAESVASNKIKSKLELQRERMLQERGLTHDRTY